VPARFAASAGTPHHEVPDRVDQGTQAEHNNIRMDVIDCTTFVAAVAKREGSSKNRSKTKSAWPCWRARRRCGSSSYCKQWRSTGDPAATKSTRELPEGLTLEDLETFAE